MLIYTTVHIPHGQCILTALAQMFILSSLIFNFIFSTTPWTERRKERNMIGTNPFRTHPSSLLKRERRIICTKRHKTPLWSLQCCGGNTLLCQRRKSTARMKAEAVLRDGRAQRVCAGKGRKGDLRVISVWRQHSHTHLHANTGSRRWRWGPVQQRSWTCLATGGRCRTAGGWAPSCWINPTPSYVLSVHPRYSFCNRNRSKINHYCNGIIKSKVMKIKAAQWMLKCPVLWVCVYL